MFVSDGVCDNL